MRRRGWKWGAWLVLLCLLAPVRAPLLWASSAPDDKTEKAGEKDDAKAGTEESVITNVDEALPNLSDIEKNDIINGNEMGRKLLDKLTPQERTKVLWMLKVALPLRRMIMEKRRVGKDATPAEFEVEAELNVTAEPSGAQLKALSEAGLAVEAVMSREETPAGKRKSSKPMIRYHAHGRLEWRKIEKLIALPLLRRTGLRTD